MRDLGFHTFVFCLAAVLLFIPVGSIYASDTKGVTSIERISPEETRSKVRSGEALLVCSYDDKKCKTMLLENSLLRSEFEQKLSTLSKNQEIIFYCG